MVKFNSLDSREGDKHNGVGLVEISDIFATRDDFFDGTAPFDGG